MTNMYATFSRGGLSHLVERMVWHYTEFNGRTFIHLVAAFVLQWGTKLFTVLNPLMMGCVFVLGCRTMTKRAPWSVTMLLSGMSIWAVLAFPVEWLNTSILWISAAFNYLFPVCALLAAFWQYKRNGNLVVTLILAFLAGATTEQCGLAAFICLVGWGGLSWLRKSMPLWKGLLPAFVAGIGYLTVVLAPGTWVRVGNEVHGGIGSVLDLPVLFERLTRELSVFLGEDALPFLFALLSAVSALHFLLTRRGSRLLLAGFPAAALYLCFFFTGHFVRASYFALAYLLFMAVLYLLREDTTPWGLLILGAAASQVVMILSTTASNRTTFPAYLMLMVVFTAIAAECLAPRRALVGILIACLTSAVCLPAYVPTLQNYAANSLVTTKNEKALMSGGFITIDLDLRSEYKHSMLYDSPAYMDTTKEYYGITDEKITYVNAPWQVAGSYGSDTAGLPIVFKEDGRPFGSIVDVVKLCGGEAGWVSQQSGVVARLGDRCYLIRTNWETYEWDSETSQPVGERTFEEVWVPWYTYYLPLDTMQRLFGIQWEYNEEENIFYFSAEADPQ